MTAQETNVTIAAESTLSGSLSAGFTTINVTDTSGFPGVPFYATIDPDRDDKREVVLVDSGKTGTTFTLTSSASRGQDGTTDVSHDAGAIIAVVPVAALWTDINDRVDALPTTAHDHDGTDAAQIPVANLTGHTKTAHDALALDHGSLSGLADFTADHGTDHDTHDHDTALAASSLQALSTTLTNTSSPGSTATQWGTEEVTVLNPGRSVTVMAWLSGYGDIPDATNTVPLSHLETSFDGGATWTAGPVSSGSLHRSGSSLRVQRCAFASTVARSGTPTGDVLVRAMAREAVGSSTTFTDGQIMALVLPS